MQKRGVSGIVVALFLVLLSLVAVVIFWGILRGVLVEKTEEIDISRLTLSYDIPGKYVLVDDSEGTVSFNVKRNAGEGNVSGFNVVLEDVSGKTQVEKVEIDIKELESKKLKINYTNLGIENLSKISIMPFVVIDDKEFVASVAASYNIKVTEIGEEQTGGLFSDTEPPGTIIGLVASDIGADFIHWTWTNPTDADFANAIIFINGENVANVSSEDYNAAGLDEVTEYTIVVYTIDNSGNINDSGVSNSATTSSAQQTDLTEGLVGYWTFDEGNAIDYSGFGNHGSVSGAKFVQNVRYSGNGAYSFDGVNDYINFGCKSIFDIKKDLSFGFWIYLRSYPENKHTPIISKQYNWDSSSTWMLRINSNTNGQFYYGDGTAPRILNWNPSTYLPLNQWRYVTGVRSFSDNYMKLYIDGSEVETMPLTGFGYAQGSSTSCLLLSRKTYYSSDGYINAIIDDVRVYNRSLNSAEINLLAGS